MFRVGALGFEGFRVPVLRASGLGGLNLFS